MTQSPAKPSPDDGVFAELALLMGITPIELMERHLSACKRALTAWSFDDVDDVGQTLLSQAARHVESAIVCVRLSKDETPAATGVPGTGPVKTRPTDIVARSRREGT